MVRAYLYTVPEIVFAVAVPIAFVAPFISDGTVQAGAVMGFLFGLALLGIGIRTFFFSSADPRVAITAFVATAALIMAVALVSQVFAGSFSLASVWGYGWESGSMETVVLFCVALVVGSFAPGRLSITFLRSFLVVAVAFAALVLCFSRAVSFPGFIPQPDGQISFLVCMAALIGCVLADRARMDPFRFLYLAAACVAALGFVFALSVSAALIGAAIGTLIVAYSFWMDGEMSTRSVPLATTCLVVVLVFVWAFGLRGPLAPLAPAADPSPAATQNILAQEYYGSLEHVLIGTGANTFPADWNLYRPALFNESAQWNVTPDNGSDTAATLAAEFGILGVLLFFFIPIVLLGYAFTKQQPARAERPAGVLEALLAGALFSFGAMIAYPFGAPFLLVGGLAAGLAANDIVRGVTISLPRVPVAGACMLGGVLFLLISSLQALGAVEHALGLAAEDPQRAATFFTLAAQTWRSPTYEMDAAAAIVQAAIDAAQAQANGGKAPDAQAFSMAVDGAEGFTSRAAAGTHGDFATSFLMAQFYLALAPYQVPDALTIASGTIRVAADHAPTRPDVFYVMAEVDVSGGNTTAAMDDLKRALELKPDYQDAQSALQTLKAQ